MLFFTNKNVSYVVGFLTLKYVVKSLKIALRNSVRIVQFCTQHDEGLDIGCRYYSTASKESVPPYDLASFDPEIQSWETDKGRYDVKFATSVEDICCMAPFTVKTAQTWPVHDVIRPKE